MFETIDGEARKRYEHVFDRNIITYGHGEKPVRCQSKSNIGTVLQAARLFGTLVAMVGITIKSRTIPCNA